MRVPWILLLLAAAVPLEGKPIWKKNRGGVLPARFHDHGDLNYFIRRRPSLYTEAAEYIPLEMEKVLDAGTRRMMISAALKHFHHIVFNKTHPKPHDWDNRAEFPYPPYGAYIHPQNIRPPVGNIANLPKPVGVHPEAYQETTSSSHGFPQTSKPTYPTATTTQADLQTTPMPLVITQQTYKKKATIPETIANLNSYATQPASNFPEEETHTAQVIPISVIQHPSTPRPSLPDTTVGRLEDTKLNTNSIINEIVTSMDNLETTTIMSVTEEVPIEPANQTDESQVFENPEFLNIVSGLIKESTTETTTMNLQATSEEVPIEPAKQTDESQVFENPEFLNIVSGLIKESTTETTTMNLQATSEDVPIEPAKQTDESQVIENPEFLNIIAELIKESTTETTTMNLPSTSDHFQTTASLETTTFPTTKISEFTNESTTETTTMNLPSTSDDFQTTASLETTTFPTTKESDFITSVDSMTTTTQSYDRAALALVTSAEFIETIFHILNENPTQESSNGNYQTTPNSLGITTTQFDHKKIQDDDDPIPEGYELVTDFPKTQKTPEIKNPEEFGSEFIDIIEEYLNEFNSSNEYDIAEGASVLIPVEVASTPDMKPGIGLQSEHDQGHAEHKDEDNESENDEFPVISLPDEDLMLISNLFPVVHVDEAEIAPVMSEHTPSYADPHDKFSPSSEHHMVNEDCSEEKSSICTQNVSETMLENSTPASEEQGLVVSTGENGVGTVSGEEINSAKPTNQIVSFDTTTFPANDENHFYWHEGDSLSTTELDNDINHVTEELETFSSHTSIKSDTPSSIIELSTKTVEETTTDKHLLDDIQTNDYESVSTLIEDVLNLQTTDIMTENNFEYKGETYTDIPTKPYFAVTTSELMENHGTTADNTDDDGDFDIKPPELATDIVETTTKTTDFSTEDIRSDYWAPTTEYLIPTTVKYGIQTADEYDEPIPEGYKFVTDYPSIIIDETTLNQNEDINVESQTSDFQNEATLIGYNTISSIVEQSNASKVAKSFNVFKDGQVFSPSEKLNVLLESNDTITLNDSTVSIETHSIENNKSDSNQHTTFNGLNETSNDEDLTERNSSDTIAGSEISGKWSLESINETEPISDAKQLSSYPNISRFIDHFFKGFSEVSSGISTVNYGSSTEEPGNADNEDNFTRTIEVKTEESNETTERLLHDTNDQANNRSGKHYEFVKSTESYSTLLNSEDDVRLPEYYSTAMTQESETTTDLIYTTHSKPIITEDETVPEEEQATTIYPYDEQVENVQFDEIQQIRIGDMLMLIPALIQELQNGTLTEEEQTVFHEMYGTLWPAIVAEAALTKSEDSDQTTTQPDRTISLPSQGRYRRGVPTKTFLENGNQDLQNVDILRRRGNPNANRSDRKLYGSSTGLNADWIVGEEFDLQESPEDRTKLFKELSKEAWEMLSRSSRSSGKVHPSYYVKEDGEILELINLVALPTSSSDRDERRRH